MSKITPMKWYLIMGGLVLIFLIAGAWWLDMQNDQNRSEARYRHWTYSVQPATVEDWMTFYYLNAVFALPPAYLRDALQMQDMRYPDLSIKQYANGHHLDVAGFLDQVRVELSAYSATSTP